MTNDNGGLSVASWGSRQADNSSNQYKVDGCLSGGIPPGIWEAMALLIKILLLLDSSIASYNHYMDGDVIFQVEELTGLAQPSLSHNTSDTERY